MPYQRVNDVQIYYERHGRDEAFPLVCINGLLSDTTSWALQVPALQEHFHVLTYDCRSQGLSDIPPGPYSQAVHVADLLGLLDALGIERLHVIGLSNGGTIAMWLAAHHPERVARLVLIDTFPMVDAVMRVKLESWLQALALGGTSARYDVALPWMYGNRFIRDNPDMIAQGREKAMQRDPLAVRTMIEGTLDYSLDGKLEQIQAPTLVIVGEEDLLTPVWYSEQIAASIPHAQLQRIAGTGHVPTLECPDLINTMLLDFLLAP
jgi:3-oxoadipate enol-lactonase